MSPRYNYIVERVTETRYAIYYRCSRGKHGGAPVSVRVGKEGIYVCLTHDAITCEHCRAVREFAETEVVAPRVAA